VRRRLAALSALASVLVLASCGGGAKAPAAKPPPQGSPATRHPPSDIAGALAVEQMRAHLLAAARLYLNKRYRLAAAQVDAARFEYRHIGTAVRGRNPVLDRELSAAFRLLSAQISQHVSAPELGRRLGPLQGQVLDAALTDAVSGAARRDPAVSALVVGRLAQQAEREYAVAGSEGFSARGVRAYQDAFGLVARAQAVARQIGALGPQQGAVNRALGDAYAAGFPTGVRAPRRLPAARVEADLARARAGLSRRFGFAA
jgi:hypothetical protein